MATLTIADLDNGKRDLQTIEEVANSRAATATTRYGQQTTTLYEAIRRINATGDEILSNLGFRVPVPYASGLNVTDSRFTVTGPDGKVYAPLSAPFTTGAWNPSQWYVLQNDLNDHKLLIFKTFIGAQAAAATLPDGQVIFSPNAEGRKSIYSVASGSLVFESFGFPFVNVMDFYDGGGDFTAAEAAASATGALVFFPEGTFDIDPRVVAAGKSVNWIGAGRYLTTIRLKPGSNNHLLSFANDSIDNEIRSLTLDQNRDSQTSGHTVRLGGVKGLKMSDFRVLNAFGYGIGVQAGSNRNVTISDFEIENTGDDALDIKDLEEGNAEIVVSDGILRNFGNIGSNKPGIDVRGPATITNIYGVLNNQNDRGLLRLRAAGAQGRHGQGTFSNLRADASTGTDCRALWVEDGVTNYEINGVSIEGGSLGTISGTGGILSNLVMRDTAANKEALSLFCTNTTVNGVTVNGCTRAVDFEANAYGNRLTNLTASNVAGADAVRFNPGADNCQLVNGSIPAGKTISDAATGTTIRDIQNWKTAANLLSPAFAVDSVGTKTLTIPHGLNVTPKPEDVSVTLSIAPSGPTDWRPTLVQVDGNPSSTNISARVVVGTASSTAGATARLLVQVRAKNS